MNMRRTAALVVLASGPASAIDNGLGLTPPMGWRSWNLFGANVNQTLMERVMDGMVARKRMVDGKPTSLCDLGYCDVGLDDNWQECGAGSSGYNYHDAAGRPVINLERFPNMSAMTAKAHGLGLTAGWYLNNCICSEGKAPTRYMYEQDVHFLTDVFRFDAVKLDGCGKQMDLDLWSQIINKTGRRVMIENCHWGKTVPRPGWCPWNFFRTSYDVRASYASVVANLLTTVQWARKNLSRPGCWAYPDMLEVGCQHGPGGAGDPGLTFAEARSHFGAWSIVSSPLTLSHDVSDDAIGDQVWPIISNKEVIRVNQAWAGHSGSPFKEADDHVHLESTEEERGEAVKRVERVKSWMYFYKPVGAGKVAVLMMNNAAKTLTLALDPQDVPGLACTRCEARDLWNHRDMPPIEGHFQADVESHDSVFLLLSPAPAPRVSYV